MSDVLHHARPTVSQFGAASHRTRFLASINERAQELRRPKPPKVDVFEAEIVTLRTTVPAVFRRPVINQIQEAVANLYGVSRNDILGIYRGSAAVLPRHVAMYIARKVTHQSWHALALKFGGRDHSTLIHACQRIEKLRATNTQLSDEIDYVIASLST